MQAMIHFDNLAQETHRDSTQIQLLLKNKWDTEGEN